MTVFRVEKNKGHTVMSNYHLRDKTLSLKDKDLLSQILSLTEDWDYICPYPVQVQNTPIPLPAPGALDARHLHDSKNSCRTAETS